MIASKKFMLRSREIAAEKFNESPRTDLSPIGEKSQAKAQAQVVRMLNVGKRSVECAAEVQEHETPEFATQARRCGCLAIARLRPPATIGRQRAPQPINLVLLAGRTGPISVCVKR